MSVPLLVFDLLICAGMLALVWRAVTAPDLFHSVVMFMVFGLLMAVTWARLGSPDLALAEAAIGAGITGALLLNACRGVMADSAPTRRVPASGMDAGLPRPLVMLFCGGAGVGLAWLMAGNTLPPDLTASMASAAAAEHALGNPVTAVLLDFRGYDTLLEMVVLLMAYLGMNVLIAGRALPDLHPSQRITAPMLAPLLALVTPVLLLTALYLYHAGSHAPGGAFQAGALLGALGVLHRLTGRLVATGRAAAPMRALLVIGLAMFSVLAWLALSWGPVPLSWPPVFGYTVLLVVEFALMLSIGVTLVLLFAAAPGLARGNSE